jgi:hypothetical protein
MNPKNLYAVLGVPGTTQYIVVVYRYLVSVENFIATRTIVLYLVVVVLKKRVIFDGFLFWNVPGTRYKVLGGALSVNRVFLHSGL